MLVHLSRRQARQSYNAAHKFSSPLSSGQVGLVPLYPETKVRMELRLYLAKMQSSKLACTKQYIIILL